MHMTPPATRARSGETYGDGMEAAEVAAVETLEPDAEVAWDDVEDEEEAERGPWPWP